MAVSLIALAVNFVASLVISSVIIHIVVNLFKKEDKGFGTAVFVAVGGSLIYTAAYFLMGGSILASIFGGIAWLVALGTLYEMGWGKAFLSAFVIWGIATLVGSFLPTLTGPL